MEKTPQPQHEVYAACGGRLDHPARYPSALFQGQRVYFCTRACLKAFEKDPERFMAGEIEHPTDEE
jgi:YHS domain-containing protein